MNEVIYETKNIIYNDEINLIISSMTDEINFIKNCNKNLIKFLYTENVKGKILFVDFQRIVDEIQRMGKEIAFLEERRLEYIKAKEKQTETI